MNGQFSADFIVTIIVIVCSVFGLWLHGYMQKIESKMGIGKSEYEIKKQ